MEASLAQDADTKLILEAPREQGQEVFASVFARHRARLKRMVQLRMGPDLQARVDASDVLQEAWLEASRRLDDYVEKPTMPFFLWLRFITRQKILILGRFHLAAQQRDARREVSIFRGALPEASTEALAAQLLGHLTTPTVAARRAEMALHLQQALNQLPEDDRQILVLRHFEQLSNAEAARELGIQESTASKRYLRALLKLKGILAPLGVEI